MKRFLALISTGVLIGSLVVLALPSRVSAWNLTATPFVFIGTREECAPYPPGSLIVTAQWMWGLGLPDSGGGNTTNTLNTTNPDTKDDPHKGLLLSKNGPTGDCSAAGAEIHGVDGMPVDDGFYLEFDARNGGHCGGGAPRFNVSYRDPLGADGFRFVGNCALATTSQAVQDPMEWTTYRWYVTRLAPQQVFPTPIPIGSTIKSINIIFDEGTNDPGPTNDPRGIGLATIDNININGQIIREGENAR